MCTSVNEAMPLQTCARMLNAMMHIEKNRKTMIRRQEEHKKQTLQRDGIREMSERRVSDGRGGSPFSAGTRVGGGLGVDECSSHAL